MSKFKQGEFKVETEAQSQRDVRVVKVEADGATNVEEFRFSKLRKPGEGSYAATREKYGALAITDPAHRARKRKNSRFNLSPMLKGRLAVEDEEREYIEKKVAAEIERMRDQAKADAEKRGFEEGLNRGYDEAFSKFREEASERTVKLDSLIREFEEAKDEIFKENERFLVELVYRIGRTITLRELATDREYIGRLAKNLLERVGVRENIALRIGASDRETIEMLNESLAKSLGSLKNINIEVSDAVKDGGCLLETEWNAIDARIETQLQGIYDALSGSAAKGGGS